MSRPHHPRQMKLNEAMYSNNNVIDFINNTTNGQHSAIPSAVPPLQAGPPTYIEANGVKYVPLQTESYTPLQAAPVPAPKPQTSTAFSRSNEDLDEKIRAHVRNSEQKRHMQTKLNDSITHNQLETERALARLEGHIEAKREMESRLPDIETLKQHHELEKKVVKLNEKVKAQERELSLKGVSRLQALSSMDTRSTPAKASFPNLNMPTDLQNRTARKLEEMDRKLEGMDRMVSARSSGKSTESAMRDVESRHKQHHITNFRTKDMQMQTEMALRKLENQHLGKRIDFSGHLSDKSDDDDW